MDQTFQFFTDTATLAIFDPQRLQHRVADDDWWTGDFAQLNEVQSGAIALVSLGIDGVYRARITDGELNADERDYACERISGLGAEVVSGALYFGPGECLPGGDSDWGPSDVERGALVDVANGEYRVDVFAIRWYDSPLWWSEDHHAPDTAPSDYVICLRLRTEPLLPVTTEPRFSGISRDFLFDSSTRQIGPQVGMILTTKVRVDAGGLALADCGPRYYRASLVDYSQVKWKDKIRFRVVTVDHNVKRITGEFIEKIISE